MPFRHIPNGIPGIETRLPLLYSEGVLGGRMTLNRFVELTATNPAKAYGLHPRKGTIAIGSDADLVIWDEREFVLSNAQLHHAVDYTPYEGMHAARLARPDDRARRGGVGRRRSTAAPAAAVSSPAARPRCCPAPPEPGHDAHSADQPQHLRQRLGR